MLEIIENEPIAAPETEHSALDKIEELLKNIKNEKSKPARLVGPDGASIEIPESVYLFLRQLVNYLVHGQAVRVVPINKEMSTQEAADLLNVSRPFLIKLLEEGQIPYYKVGTHRRIGFDDLMQYKKNRDKNRKEALDELTRLSQEYGEYD